MTRYNSNLTPEQTEALTSNFRLAGAYLEAMQETTRAEMERNNALNACMHGTRHLTDDEAHELLEKYKNAEKRYQEAKANQEKTKKALDENYARIMESRILR